MKLLIFAERNFLKLWILWLKEYLKNDFCDLLNFATKESFFMFNNKFYVQVDGVAMGSPQGPILANIFLLHHEEITG